MPAAPEPGFGFSADRPIASRTDDLLGRVPFAESLARAINHWRGKDSLVVALYGPWGSGKSSIKNMVCEVLGASGAGPLILQFNPWEWAAQERIIEGFFQQVGLLLGRSPEPKTKVAAARWKSYASYLTLGGSGIANLEALAVLLGAPPGMVVGVAGMLQQAGSVASAGADALKAKAERETKTLGDLKAELSASLAEVERSVLVVMDDIDRLTASEVRVLFQLVKANADLPNLIFLLLFQRDQIEKSLDAIAPGSGAEFLEKIVQVGFDVPQVDAARLHGVLDQGFARMLGSESISKAEKVRFGNLFHGGMAPYFVNLRDVYRFLSTLEFHAVAHRQEGVLNVNPVDLIGIECLRVFAPEVFKRLPGMKLVLTEAGQHIDGKEKRESIETLLGVVPEPQRDQVREILSALFEPADWVLKGHGYGHGFEAGWTRNLRACDTTMFDRYFQLSIRADEVSEAEVRRVLSSTNDREKLTAMLRDFNRRGCLATLLTRLVAHREEFDLAHAPALVTAIFDIGDELPFVDGASGDGPEWSAVRIVHWYLMREPDQAARGRVLIDAARKTTGLFLPVFKTSIESSKEEHGSDPQKMAVGDDDRRALQKICVEKIRRAAQEGSLRNQPKLAHILYRWREWDAESEAKRWVASLTETPAGAARFVAAIAVSVASHGMGDRVASSSWQVRMVEVEAFVDPDVLAGRLAELDPAEVSERELEAVRAFQHALRRREDGKGDPGPLSVDDADE